MKYGRMTGWGFTEGTHIRDNLQIKHKISEAKGRLVWIRSPTSTTEKSLQMWF